MVTATGTFSESGGGGHRRAAAERRAAMPGLPCGIGGPPPAPSTTRGRRWRSGGRSPARGSPPAPRIQQLKDLASLKEQGILTDAEFAEQKARILGS